MVGEDFFFLNEVTGEIQDAKPDDQCFNYAKHAPNIKDVTYRWKEKNCKQYLIIDFNIKIVLSCPEMEAAKFI